MFVNAFLAIPGLKPGQFPSGGPIHRLLDVYHAAAPNIDVLSPNAYSPDFKGICALYTRAGNPLLIPETGPVTGNLFGAVGHHAALAWSPFGAMESLRPGGQLDHAYQALNSVMPELTEWQSEGKVDAILLGDGEEPKPVSLAGYKITLDRKPTHNMPAAPGSPSGQAAVPSVQAAMTNGPAGGPLQPPTSDARPFAIIVNTGPDEFLFIGANGVPKFAADSPGPEHVAVISKDEGRYDNGKWIPGRRLNGDEVDEGLPETGVDAENQIASIRLSFGS